MPATFVATGSVEASAGVSSIPWPTHQTGDVGIMVIESGGNDTTPTPVGWTHFSWSPVVDIADATGSKLSILYKFAASSSESAVTIADLGDHWVGNITTFRGVADPPTNVRATGIKTTASTTATLPSVTPTDDNCVILLICSRPNDSADTSHFGLAVNANLTGITEVVEGGTTLGHGGGYVIQRAVMPTASATGTSTMTKTVSTTDAYFVLALDAAPEPPPDGYISAPGPLAAPVLTGYGQTPTGYASAPSVLSAPFLLSEVTIASLVSVPSPLIGAQVVTFSDFSTAPELLRSVDYYACDIVDGANTYRVKISSWQATLQLDASNYLQAVIPACDQYMDILTGLSEDAEFVIIKGARLSNGTNVENELARAPVSLRFDQGPQRHTCTMSGYSDAFTLPTSPSAVTDRTLRDVRSSSTDTGGRRFRCAIDWFLRPGQTAIYEEQTMLVSYMNYYVTMDGQGDAYMDVGERI